MTGSKAHSLGVQGLPVRGKPVGLACGLGLRGSGILIEKNYDGTAPPA